MRSTIHQSIQALILASARRSATLGTAALVLACLPAVANAQEQGPHQLRLEGAAALDDGETVGGGLGFGYEYRLLDSLGIVGSFAADLFPNEDSGVEDGTGSYRGLDGQLHEVEADGVMYPSTKLRYYGAGGGLRLHALPAASSVDLWLDTRVNYVRIREEARPGFDVGLGADFSVGDDGFAVGSFVRYTQVIQPGGDGGRDDDRFVQVGAALSWGGASKASRALYTHAEPASVLEVEDELEPDADDELASEVALDEVEPETDAQLAQASADDSEAIVDDSEADAIFDEKDDCSATAGGENCPTATASAPSPVVAPSPTTPSPARTQLGKLPMLVAFGYGENRVTSSEARNLRKVLKVLRGDPAIRTLQIVGHTDERGGPEENMALSQERAQAVVDWLVAHGIAQSRLQAIGRGASEPRVDGQSQAAWRANRRVQFIVTETGEPAP